MIDVRVSEVIPEIEIIQTIHDETGCPVGIVMIHIKSQTEGLQLAKAIEEATIAKWPVAMERGR